MLVIAQFYQFSDQFHHQGPKIQQLMLNLIVALFKIHQSCVNFQNFEPEL